ncbi:MAG: gliding motility-associated C-terminal domain-containing protein [Flavobacteriales bacterium]|nr:gliding motility-associated C-terminal domain-containing protein [Flavobacteriales bacterium]
MRTPLLLTLLFGVLGTLSGAAPRVPFTENKGQWPAQVLYRANIPGGVVFVERNALTYVLKKGGEMEHHGHSHSPGHAHEPLRMHAYRVTFEGASGGMGAGEFRQPHYENFFIGNDPAQWGTGCAVFGEVWVKGLYPGVDLRLDGRNGLKYDLVLAPGADPAQIRLRYDGQDGLQLKDGALHVRLVTGPVVEEAPISFALAAEGGEQRSIPSAYKLEGNQLSFVLEGSLEGHPNGLVIDPVLSFASYTGSTADNFGCTATYDNDGHLYGGGIVFGFGYPVTLGVLQGSMAGGTIDIGLTKFTPDGSALVWSTYLGGALGNESPHSLVVNTNNELFVLAHTGSTDAPVTPGCFDPSFNGGLSLNWTGVTGGYGFNHTWQGTDILVAHLNATATALIGCTYVGGTGNDGLNNTIPTAHNYGDAFRGEIAIDGQGRPVIVTSTESADMPVTPGAQQPAFGGGGQDAYVFRLNAALTSLQWATYCGGSGVDAGFGVQFDSNGEIYITGGTSSSNLPMAGTPFQSGFSGGTDGYIMRYGVNGAGPLLGGTFLGTSAYDQCYFVQLNTSDEVFVYGQSLGAYPVTPGKYVNPNSSQFVHKLSHDLGTSLWSTRLGNGNPQQNLSPCAFLVSDCGQIYLAGWAGTVNNNAGLMGSSTTGMPISPGAFQSSTDGSDFHLMVLEPEAAGLNYATYFGGGLSAEHVDGGTSRFDKNGTVYQAVCAGCGGQDDFPTSPGAWSNTNNAFNCNLGVFKFDLTQTQAIIGINGPGYVCIPDAAQFTNNSNGGSAYFWTFGDGNTSTLFAPTHVYATPGTYTVTMVLNDTTGCLANDTASITINVLEPPQALIDSVGPVCPGGSVQLQAYGGTNYQWFPVIGLSASNIPNPIATPVGSTEYFVAVSNQCGSDTTSIMVVFGTPNVDAGPGGTICLGQSLQLNASGGVTYQWAAHPTLSALNTATPNATPTDTTTYVVTITTADGCVASDSVTVIVQFGVPTPVSNDESVCVGGSVQLNVSGGDSYAWSPAPGISTLTIPNPVVSPPQTMYYTVTLTNTCGNALDSVLVTVVQVVADAWPDTVVCPGESVTLFASGGVDFVWSPPAGLSSTTGASVIAAPTSTTLYTVVVSDPAGCQDVAQVLVETHPSPTVYAGSDVTIVYGDAVQLSASGSGSFVWSPETWLNCTVCQSPWASPETSTLYTVELTDANGCKATDQVLVIIEGTLYVPNTFTPNGDGTNDFFFALATEVKEFKLYVFNRWGELIFEADSPHRFWDGTYSGTPSPIDTYVWRIDLTELSGESRMVIGHVNLVR